MRCLYASRADDKDVKRPEGSAVSDLRSMFSRSEAAHRSGSPSAASDGNLRQRGSAAPPPRDDQMQNPDSDAPITMRDDPLKLFAGLVPPPLRKSQKDFNSGKHMSIDGTRC